MARPDASAVETTPSLQPQAESRAIQRVEWILTLPAPQSQAQGSGSGWQSRSGIEILSSKDILIFPMHLFAAGLDVFRFPLAALWVFSRGIERY
ncbi:LOW QUALITY PROTEIN: hypothetical protein MKX08_010529 [Trichoderma sp. CBMAI-0020]|nr:LOW QUALITY PROTEIN: hypothetical protein MKX08_010529 [Trichoderma sp. CBMAI-0020]